MSKCPRRNFYSSSPLKHILLISNDQLGDTLIRIPFYAALRKAFPPSAYHIAVAMHPTIAKLLSKLPYFDEVIPTEQLNGTHAIFWLFSKGRIICNILRWSFLHKIDILINPIRRRSLGLDYLLYLSQPSVSIAYTSDAMKDLFPATQSYQKKRFDNRYTFLIEDKNGASLIESMQNILCLATKKQVQLSPVSFDDISILFTAPKSALPHTYCVFVPGAGSQFRQWPPERFAKVAKQLLQLKNDIVIILVGTKAEWSLGEEIRNKADARILNWCGKTSLSELGSILRNSRLVLTNETGTATYSAIVGAPTLCLVGGGDFNAFFPTNFYKNTKSIYHFNNCFYCMWKCCKINTHSSVAPCILCITEKEVYDNLTLMI